MISKHFQQVIVWIVWRQKPSVPKWWHEEGSQMRKGRWESVLLFWVGVNTWNSPFFFIAMQLSSTHIRTVCLDWQSMTYISFLCYLKLFLIIWLQPLPFYEFSYVPNALFSLALYIWIHLETLISQGKFCHYEVLETDKSPEDSLIYFLTYLKK